MATTTTTTATPNDITIKHLTSQDLSANPSKLQEILDLSISVFTPLFPPGVPLNDSNNLAEWHRRLSIPNAIIYYATPTTSDEPLGFFFSSPRKQEELIGDDELRQHIWLVAISPKAQGLGIFPVLMERSKQFAREAGFREITIGTRPTTFKKMYRMLGQYGWEEVARQERDGWPWVLLRMGL